VNLTDDQFEDELPKKASKLFPSDTSSLIEFVLFKLWRGVSITESVAVTSSGFRSSAFLEPPILDKGLVMRLMISVGLHEWADNDDLLQRMVDVANTSSGYLDVAAFVSALTSDLDAWQVGDEVKDSTYACDVFGPDGVGVFTHIPFWRGNGPREDTEERGTKKDGRVGDEEGKVLEKDGSQLNNCETSADVVSASGKDAITEMIQKSGHGMNETFHNAAIHRIRLLDVIDFVVDAFSSFSGLILIWAVYISYAGSYASLILTLPAFQLSCDPMRSEGGDFGCVLGVTVITWLLIACLLVLFGMIGKLASAMNDDISCLKDFSSLRYQSSSR
jgi:hypothetical protein